MAVRKDKKSRGRGWKIAGIVLACVIALYVLVCLAGGYLFYPSFYGQAKKAAPIPDMPAGFTPQGITWLEEEKTYLLCGYMPGGENSRIYVIPEGGEPRLVKLEREDRSAYTGHAGGITNAGDYVYISNASKIFCLKKADLLVAKDGSAVAFEGYLSVPCRASFISCDGKDLYVGEYHAEGYETEESHIVKTDSGEEYAALVFAYALGEGPFGIAEPAAPRAAYAVPDFVQGFAMTGDGRAVLSRSHGLAASLIESYRPGSSPSGTFTDAALSVPLYILDEKHRTATLRAPHMSEDCEVRGGELILAFEGGARQYGAGLLPFSVTSVMTVPIP